MNQLFIRIFYKKDYFEYNLEFNKKVYLSIINKAYYVGHRNHKVYSNFINEVNFELNKLYYNEKEDFYYMIGVYSKQYYINQEIFNLNEIVLSDCNVIIDLVNKFIEFTTPIYIEKKRYENGKFYFSNDVVICIDIYQFKIENNIASFKQQANYKNNNYFQYENTKELNYINENTFNYQFEFLENFEKHNESISRYIIPPIIMLVVMVVVALFTKRMNMIIFMLTSSISTVSASLIMFFKQKQRVKINNDYINQKYILKRNSLKKKIISDLKTNYKTTNFYLASQTDQCLGYTLKQVNVETNIKEDKLKCNFESTISNIGKFHKKLYFNEVSIVGKYSMLFLYNYLLSIIANNYCQQVIFIGDFKPLRFITNAHYLNSKSEITNKIFSAIIISNSNEELSKLVEDNIVIYLNNENNCKNIIEINNTFKNRIVKYNNKKSNEYLYSLIEEDLKKLYLIERKITFNNSRNILRVKGIRLSRDFILDIEKEGPHGLVVGMTGSGKSILLLQIILQIAMNYTPIQAVIGIIDFKGDALISKVKSLPHIASTFSNLNGGYENVIAAIKNELIYRQKFFSKHNISEYNEINNKSYLPRLFIIIDEFAELRKQLSQISEEIESIARIGRSLGVYLIISLQKSSGILSEQLKSNINYSICLKVNSVQDSLEVINEKQAAYFKVPGEAIVKINNNLKYINVFNCLEELKEEVIINGINKSNISYIDYQIARINKLYKKTSYIIWKTFPQNDSNKVLLNFNNSKKFKCYDFNFENYIIVGNKQSGKSELVKTIIKDFNYCIIYLGKDKSFIDYVDMYIESNVHIEVYINYLKTLNTYTYLIVDGFELYNNEILLNFIEECTCSKYENMKVVITTITIVNSLSRLVKLFTHKFMLSVNDPSEAYNIFYKSYSKNRFDIGEGVCICNEELVEFKNYISSLNKSSKVYAIKANNLVYLNDFSKLNLEHSILIYDNDSIDNNFENSFYYQEVNDIKLSEHSNKIILTTTDRFEYKFRKAKILEGMLYDFTNNEVVVNLNNLNYK